MAGNGSRSKWLSAMTLLLCGLLAGCGAAEPTVTTAPAPTQPPAPTAFTSPLEGAAGSSTTFESPLAEPTATTSVGTTKPLSPIPTGTPDPGLTPVAIANAELAPDREVITIKNVSAVDQDIGNWFLFNVQNEPSFRFPEGLVLEPGEAIEVYSAVPEEEVPEGALFWTEERIWHAFPADVMLLNSVTRLMFHYTGYEEQ